jgi:subtilisin family serine protease
MCQSATARLGRMVFLVCAIAAVSITVSVAAPAGLLGPGSADRVEPVSANRAVEIDSSLARGLAGAAGPIKAWVFFTDKGFDTPDAEAAAVQAVAASYDQHAVQRRLLRGPGATSARAMFDGRDLPVAQAYVDAVTATGANVHVASRWLNAVSAYVTADQAAHVAELGCVRRVQAVARGRRIAPFDVQPQAPASPGAPRDGDDLDYGSAAAQLNQINLLALHHQGYTADGIIVGILDTGFQRTHQAFNNPLHPLSVVAEWDFVNNDPDAGIQPGDASDQHAHGTMILGVLGAYLPGNLVGGAYDASFVLCKTEDVTREVPVEEDNYVAGLEFIEAHGADLATSSLGYIDWYTQAQLDGQTAVTTIAVNTAASLGVYCCTAAGNNGHDANALTSHLIAPADGLKELTCGAVDAAGLIADFSSDGPTADGRVKPELLARGVSTFTVSPSDNSSLATASGTSLSTPLVACAVACLTQAHPEWTVDQMRSALINSAADFIANGTFDPLYIRGYGVVNAYAASQDCNGNGLPDLADITAGTSTDANGNGVPDECEPMLGDMDCNYVVDLNDVAPFVLALMSPADYQSQFPICDLQHADLNSDGLIDGRDIQSFVELLLP